MEEYLQKYRNDVVDGRRKAIEELDKAVLALSSAAIGATFAIIKTLVHPSAIHSQWLLVTSWGLWSSSILLTILSFIASYLAHTNVIRLIDKDTLYALGANPEGGWNTCSMALKYFSLCFYAVGVVLFAIFLSFNITETNPHAANPDQNRICHITWNIKFVTQNASKTANQASNKAARKKTIQGSSRPRKAKERPCSTAPTPAQKETIR